MSRRRSNVLHRLSLRKLPIICLKTLASLFLISIAAWAQGAPSVPMQGNIELRMNAEERRGANPVGLPGM